MEEDDVPEEDEDNDCDSEDAAPEIPLPEVETINNVSEIKPTIKKSTETS